MIKFRSILDDTSSFVSESGSPYLDQYEYDVDKKGVKRLVKIDKQKDVYSAIQADYDSTDINLIMKRFALGDLSAIDVKSGFYADVTKMPKNMAELFDKAEECRQFFDTLPVEFKQLFNNSYTEFFSQLNSDEKSVIDIVDKYNDQFVNHQFDEEESVSDVKAGEEVE